MNNRYLYAQIDDKGLVVAKSDLKGEVIHPSLVAISLMDECQLGDTYHSGAFVTSPQTEEGT